MSTSKLYGWGAQDRFDFLRKPFTDADIARAKRLLSETKMEAVYLPGVNGAPLLARQPGELLASTDPRLFWRNLAGVILLVLGRHRPRARQYDYIPRPVVIGFTNGIALLIASTQIKDFFGLQDGRQPQRIFRPHAGGCERLPDAGSGGAALCGGVLAGADSFCSLLRFFPRGSGSIVAFAVGHRRGDRMLHLPVATDRGASSEASAALCRPFTFRNFEWI